MKGEKNEELSFKQRNIVSFEMFFQEFHNSHVPSRNMTGAEVETQRSTFFLLPSSSSSSSSSSSFCSHVFHFHL